MTVTRREVKTYLQRLGFVPEPRGPSSHMTFARGPHRVTLPDHGPQTMQKGSFAIVLRQLERAGVPRDRARRLEP